MTAIATNSRRVRPADHREPRVRQVRGPVARPAGLTMPGGRPVQPASPALDEPVRLVRRPATLRAQSPARGVRLTERALGLILACLAVVVVAGGLAVVTQFLAVSDAPLAEGAALGSVADVTRG